MCDVCVCVCVCVSPLLLSEDSCHAIGSKGASPIARKETHGVGFTITIDLPAKIQQENSPIKPEHSQHSFFSDALFP